jgi:hypothetical protein
VLADVAANRESAFGSEQEFVEVVD